MEEFIKIFFATCTSVILGGISNMIFAKTKLFSSRAKPIDKNKTWQDGKPILGKNKTGLGFIGMIVFTAISQVVLGIIMNDSFLNNYNPFYSVIENNVLNNITIGTLLGFCYMLFELPNSFIKRRLDIVEGTTKNSFIGKLFFIIDQIDSLIGIGIFIYLVTGISGLICLCLIIFGGLIHISVNLCLYSLRIRKNI